MNPHTFDSDADADAAGARPRGLFVLAPIVLLTLLGISPVAAATAPEPPVQGSPAPVSPGGASRLTPVRTGCPTFSWTSAADADGYEIAVYELSGESSDGIGDTPVLHQVLPAGAGSWTPSADRCLRPAGRYAWSVRPLIEGRETPWSEPLLLEVLGRTAAEAPGTDRPEVPGEPSRRSEDERGTSEPRTASPARRETGTVEAAEAALAPRVTPAAAKLAVRGSIQTDSDFTYSALRALRVWIPAASFIVADPDEDDGWLISPNGFGFVSSAPDSIASVALVATVPRLPDGATITSFTCHFVDLRATAELSLSFNLRLRNASDLSAAVIASASGSSSSNASAVLGFFDDSIAQPQTSPSTSSYTVEGTFEADTISQDLRFYGCSIDLLTRTVRP
jgi:hypothetical protein